MIIAGNSNVHTFRQQGMVAATDCESTSVLWVGALTSQHFFDGHPAGKKVRELFAGHDGWKFLSIGTHDIYALCRAATQPRFTESLAATKGRFSRALSELKGDGRIGWLVFPQPAREIRLEGIAPEEILSIARSFNRQMEQWCQSQGIAVINPLSVILGPDGEPWPHFLQKDGIHLNADAARIYMEEISRLTGVTLEFQNDAPVFEPLNEPESFCSLLLGTLNLPLERGLAPEVLQERLVAFVTELLKGKGLELEIDAQTELVDSGLLDSLNLVETYTHAVNAIGGDIDFDVDLRSLDTVAKICHFFAERKALSGSAPQGPTFSDFITSLRGDFEDPAQRAPILEADQRIASLDRERIDAFTEHFYIVSNSYNCNYGIIYFWLSFWAAAKGEYQTALELLNHGSSAKITYPFQGPHVQHYLDRWRTMVPPRITIVTASLNQAQHLEACILSVLSQDYPNLEYIIIDGGSTDGSLEIIKKYSNRLSFWQSQPDGGRYRAINEGLRRSTGEIMGWLDAEDLLHPGALEVLADVFTKRQEVEFLTGKRIGFDGEGKMSSSEFETKTWSRSELLRSDLTHDLSLFVMQGAAYWRRGLWERSGGTLDLSFKLAADFELWLRFSRQARLHTVEALIAGGRYHSRGQRCDQFRGEYLAECCAAIERERRLPPGELDYAPPPAPSAHPLSEGPRQQSAIRPSGEGTPRLEGHLNEQGAGRIPAARDLACTPHGGQPPATTLKEPQVTAVVSAHNSERFLAGCLADLTGQSLYSRGELEIVVVDSGSQQDEESVVRAFQAKGDHIVYLKGPRETLYGAWNRGIRVARGRYLTSANTDDRRAPEALEVLAAALDENPAVDLVYGDCYISVLPNETFEENVKERCHRYPDFFPPDALLHYQFGPQPMWRRSLHDRIGYFEEEFRAAGDYDFNIRFALNCQALHLPLPLGLYLEHRDALSFRDDSAIRENHRVKERYRSADQVERLYQRAGFPNSSPEEKARIHLSMGSRALSFYPPWFSGAAESDHEFALTCLQRARALLPCWPPRWDQQALKDLARGLPSTRSLFEDFLAQAPPQVKLRLLEAAAG